jgi:hypothetical protein
MNIRTKQGGGAPWQKRPIMMCSYMSSLSTPRISRKSSQTELSVLKLIQMTPAVSRVELSTLSGLSSAAITGVISGLIAKGLLVEERSEARAIGRKRVALSLRRSLGYVVGIDLGTFNLRIAVTDLNGDVIAGLQIKTEMWRGREAVIERCFDLVRETLAKAQVNLLICMESVSPSPVSSMFNAVASCRTPA